MILEALVAAHSLVVATIMPDVRDDLGRTELYGLAFTAVGLGTIASIPVVGAALDRYGARRVLTPVLAVFAAGLIVAALAPAMPVLVIGQFLFGVGGGGLYALSIGAVAKIYPDRLRPRVMALLATMWILPGLIGPPLGAFLATAVGWRFAFLVPFPIMLVGWALIAPSLDLIPTLESENRIPLRWPLQLMVGAGLTFTAITVVEWWAIPVAATGLAIGIPALLRVAPRGTFRAEPGLPAAALAALLLSMGFIGVDAFLTLMLTDVRGLSLAEASLVITLASITWASGSAWQSGRAQRYPLGRIVGVGAGLVLAGSVITAAVLWAAVPVWAAFIGWSIVGAGMGIAWPTIPLAAIRAADEGQEAGEVSSVLLMDVIGISTGAALGGGIIAVTQASGSALSAGIGGSFALAGVALVGLIAASPRIPGRPQG